MTKDLRIGVSALAAGVIAFSSAFSAQAADMPRQGPAPAKKYMPAKGGKWVGGAHKGATAPGGVGMGRGGGGMGRGGGGMGSASPYPVSARKKGSDWSGPYVGGHIGYAWLKSSLTAGEKTTSAGKAEFGVEHLSGLFFGGQAGYLAELDQNIIVGVEADFSWVKDASQTKVEDGPEDFLFKTNIPWIASLRGRVGSAMDNYMVYGTAGITFSDVEKTYSPLNKGSDIEVKKRVSGWVVGGGLEVLLADNLTTRLEYLYHHMAGNLLSFSDGDNKFDLGHEIKDDLSVHAVRLGVNLKF